ncbi:Uncharacterised protein [uncultured archaeon]|nr:Uncharacterised protein [uncultured archaeon]
MDLEFVLSQLQVGAVNFLGNLLQGVFAFLILAVVLLIGLYVAKLLGNLLKKTLEKVSFDKMLEKHHLHDAFLGFTLSGIVVLLVELFVMAAFVKIGADIVNIPLLSYFALQAINYAPLLMQGVIILLFALLAGEYISNKIRESKGVPFANNVAMLVEFFIAYNALVIVLPLIFPAANPTLLVWSFMAILAALVIALGFGFAIAIGLGLKDSVADVAKKNKDKFSKLL